MMYGLRGDVCGVCLLAILVLLCSQGKTAELRRLPDSVWFGDRQFSLSLDARNGAPVELRRRGKVVARDSGATQFFDLKEDETWITGSRRVRPRLSGVERVGPSAILATVIAGDWEVKFRYRLDASNALLTRSARITWRGAQPTKLKGFWIRTPRIAATDETYYYFPGAYPAHRYGRNEYREGVKHSSGQSPAPLIAQLSARRSALWITDELTPASDRSTVSVAEDESGFRVGQGFNIMARMKPGDSQDVGDACLWLLDADGEGALRYIHEWMRERGHVVPADRPAWFSDAVIYSFHPGGTIGSGFKDLGGFAEATKLLDNIAAMGCTAVWIMPIEDAGVYHPRDYYKFQEGLGTAEDYRALVDRAHELGLHVLQDIVPHGGRNDYPRAKAHPEWLAYEEDGSTLDYWCYDFNWPTWREYMAGVARHYVSEFDVDGYRVDAVGGSRIPNWSPDIPYGRASFAQLQGGLNMLRSLRAAVKGIKPREGGLLAEVQGSVYGTVSDAIYDFTGCYQAYHDLRRLPPDEFVSRMRRWLHEQQYAEAAGLLRLRHVESHDSLRSQLWYGVRPERALMALTAWIHGIPLVYHEMENGNTEVFRRIFAIRAALPELRGGEADYLCAETPPSVFACLRSDANGASVVLINFSGDRVQATARVPLSALPQGLRSQARAYDAWLGGAVDGIKATGGRLALPFSLPPFGFTVYALRSDEPPSVAPSRSLWEADAPAAEPSAGPSGALIEFAGDSYRAWVDAKTGLPAKLQVRGRDVMGPADLYLPPHLAAAATPAVRRAEGKRTVFERRYGRSLLQIEYEPTDAFLRVRARWSGDETPRCAALYLPFTDASRWYAATAEGALKDAYRVRHLPTESAFGNIYWRPQGTNVVWDSALEPFGLAEGSRRMGARAGGQPVALRFDADALPARAQWLDRIRDRRELAAMIAWRDPGAPMGDGSAGFAMDIVPDLTPPRDVPADRLRPVGGGWEFENEHYRIRIARTGVITALWAKRPRPRLIVDGGDLYTDAGFGPDKKAYHARDEAEAAARIWREGNAVRLRCEGRLRGGIYRFELLSPPIEYYFDYTLDESQSLRVSWGVKPLGAPHGNFAFLSLLLPVSDVRHFAYARKGRVLHEGDVGDGSRRAWQTKELKPPAVPDRVELSADDGRLLTLGDLLCGGAAPIRNAFVHGRNFFLAWEDGPPTAGRERQWRWASAVMTPGAAEPVAVGKPPAHREPVQSPGLLQDPGFEQAVALQPVSASTGQPLPGAQAMSAWMIPAGGRLIAEPVHRGHAAAEVVSATGGYRLWRQSLQAAQFPAGTRWRLSAWVRGEDIKQGDISWKVGTLRFAISAGGTQYASCPPLTGTFDWKEVTAEATIPEELRSIAVEAGLNGATGKMWIDDVRLEEVK